jgi:hypothetical protein
MVANAGRVTGLQTSSSAELGLGSVGLQASRLQSREPAPFWGLLAFFQGLLPVFQGLWPCWTRDASNPASAPAERGVSSRGLQTSPSAEQGTCSLLGFACLFSRLTPSFPRPVALLDARRIQSSKSAPAERGVSSRGLQASRLQEHGTCSFPGRFRHTESGSCF